MERFEKLKCFFLNKKFKEKRIHSPVKFNDSQQNSIKNEKSRKNDCYE